MVVPQWFTAPASLTFLRRLLWHARRTAFLIIDECLIHWFSKVTQWGARHSEQMRLSSLPGCSPDLSPDELFTRDVTIKAGGHSGSRHQGAMVDTVRKSLRSTHRKP